MKYLVKSTSPETQSASCVVVGIFDRRKLTDAALAIEKASDGALSGLMNLGDMDGGLGKVRTLYGVTGTAADRVMLVGLGKESEFNDRAWRKAQAAAIAELQATGATDAVSYLTQVLPKERDARWGLQQAVIAAEDALYTFKDCKGKNGKAEKKGKDKKENPRVEAQKFERYTFDVGKRDLAAAEKGLAEGLAIAKGMTLTKNLGNLPGNLCTPTYLAQQAQGLAKQYPIKTRVLDRPQMEKLGMGSFLSVAKGSSQPPKLIVMEYFNGPKGEKPVALVGKGLTFDAGGISIKPAAKMDEMKFDMCGGASVFGTLAAIAELKLKVNVVGIVPATENLINGEANKPGDIVTSMAGITIEVLNTDAEGRLILCDALTYAEQEYEPSVCIDIATLTGAVIVAIGATKTGLFFNNEELGRSIKAASETTGDSVWELPMGPEYDEMMRSEFADIANIATRGEGAGASQGAVFLGRFTKKMKWAHLDIAGVAWSGKKASGRPVPLLTQYLIGRAAK